MKPFHLAVCALALGACAPTAPPAPLSPSTPPAPPAVAEQPPPPEPLTQQEGRGPDAIRDCLLREHPAQAPVIAGLRIVEDDGAVTVTGFVPDEPTGYTLLASVRHVTGVRAVRNDLLVLARPAPEGAAASRTGEAIRSWLRRERPDAVGEGDSFRVYERDGFVTLYGKVNDEQVRRDLVGRVKQMPDVKQVEDRLEIDGPGRAPAGPVAATPAATPAACRRALTGRGAAPRAGRFRKLSGGARTLSGVWALGRLPERRPMPAAPRGASRSSAIAPRVAPEPPRARRRWHARCTSSAAEETLLWPTSNRCSGRARRPLAASLMTPRARSGRSGSRASASPLGAPCTSPSAPSPCSPRSGSAAR